MDKAKLMEKLKGLSSEDRALFRETLMEIEPAENSEVLTGEEILAFREFLSTAKKKGEKKKGGGILAALDSLLEKD